LRFAPVRTRKLTFLFTTRQVPLQVSNVVIPGVRPLSTPSGPFRLPCGLGPVVELNGRVVATQVSGTFADLLTGRPMPFTACSAVTIAAGANRVVEPVKDFFDVQDVALVRRGGALAGGALSGGGVGKAVGTPRGSGGGGSGQAAALAGRAVVRWWTPARRVLLVTAPTRSYLVVNENFNSGWQATLGRRALRAARIDGWKQAWLLPAGTTGTVTLAYLPNTLYRDAIAGGLGTLALVLLVAVWPAGLGLTRARAWRPRRLALPQRWRPKALWPQRSRVPAAAAPARPQRTPSWPRLRLRRPRLRPGFTAALASALAACGLLAMGLWLGGYPGAAILAAATGLFVAAVSYRRNRRVWLELSRPWVVAGLVLTAAASGAAGERLSAGGASGPLVTALANTAPQVICMVVVGRLVAALIVGDP
jgi:arabinofuranan 3-O-arabinosyltransferase